ncbi:hypothetical protein HMPREF0043_00042 [Actinobaculum sp. oral taxon 183 str. F0552]|nr:hypothetical protein HMPREF0043_00042 [Actinobaculum sp. oral taxon 183 str. F0552]
MSPNKRRKHRTTNSWYEKENSRGLKNESHPLVAAESTPFGLPIYG